MESRDIIISVNACGGKMKCQVEAQKFNCPPIVLTVPGGSADGFRKTAQAHRKNHTVLDSFLAVMLGRKGLSKKVKPRRICLVSWGEGWTWISEVLQAKKDVPRIDTVLVMNGASSSKAWLEFAARCEGRMNSSKLWLVHNQIKKVEPANKRIFKAVTDRNVRINIPSYIGSGGAAGCVSEGFPIRVYSKTETPKTKFFHHDPLMEVERAGNVARFEYGGNSAHDELYLAHHVQPRFWHWLRDLWKDPYSGVFYA